MIPDISSLITAGALFVSNHSGGKDSQAMLINLLEVIPPKQLVVVHASLGAMEWPGALELAQKQAEAAGIPFIVARAHKTLLEMVERRFVNRPEVPSWPSASPTCWLTPMMARTSLTARPTRTSPSWPTSIRNRCR